MLAVSQISSPLTGEEQGEGDKQGEAISEGELCYQRKSCLANRFTMVAQ